MNSTITSIRIAIIGNSPPRQCGIATFTQNLANALVEAPHTADVGIYAMDDGSMEGSKDVRLIPVDDEDAYVRAAHQINEEAFDIVSIQHEFGIYGGASGRYILRLIDELKVPIVPTLHTLLTEPSHEQREVLEHILQSSERVVTMSQKGSRILRETYRVDSKIIDVIPHGVPEIDKRRRNTVRVAHNLEDRPLVLTFGLVSRGKGLEYAIRSMRIVADQHPNALLCILGATHPNLVKREGEVYRHELESLVHELGLNTNVRFINKFVSQEDLTDWLAACDVYVAPYPNLHQVTSGTLAYAFASHTPVVSTPFWHAVELLANGRGILVPERCEVAMGEAVSELIAMPECRRKIVSAAAELSKKMYWPRVAETYDETFRIAAKGTLQPPVTLNSSRTWTLSDLPKPSLNSLVRMTDDGGLYQHGDGPVPDLAHGYCTDDNGRALGVLSSLKAQGQKSSELTDLADTYFQFVKAAYIPESNWFCNFRSAEDRWLDDGGSEDCQARTVHALAITAASGPEHLLPEADALFRLTAESLSQMMSVRGMAFGILALEERLKWNRADGRASYLLSRLAERLYFRYLDQSSSDWTWFEPKLSYDNARLSQALIVGGDLTANEPMLRAGESSLHWLMNVQTHPTGVFAPIGSHGFYERDSHRAWYGQQVVDVWATISACRSAYEVSENPKWRSFAELAYGWLYGTNMQLTPMVDIEDGHSYDGLEASGRSRNVGAESILSYLGILSEMKIVRSLTERVPLAS